MGNELTQKNSVIYNTLYDDTQKPFINYLINEKHALDNENGFFSWGMFLRMGFGKTKLLCTMAELHNADLVFVTSIKVKTTERVNEDFSFAYELMTAGYKCFHSDQVSKNKKNEIEFLNAINAGEKIAYIFNYEQLLSKKGYAFINYLVGGYNSLNIRERRDYLYEQYLKTDMAIPFEEWFLVQGPNKGKGYNNIVWLLDEAHNLNNKTAGVSKLVRAMLKNKYVPNVESQSRPNYFKEKIKGFYLGTGTPTTGQKFVNYFFLLQLLGHEWGETPIEVECYEPFPEIVEKDGKRVTKMVEKPVGVMIPPERINRDIYIKGKGYRSQKESAYDYFVRRYCEIDEETKFYNQNAKNITGYMRTDELLNIVDHYAFFGDTAKHFDLPPERKEIIWVPKGYGYDEMTDPRSPTYRVFGDFIADTPALLYLRARQLTSGFMGNKEHYEYFNLEKATALQHKLMVERGNYIIFYQYHPELYAIVNAVEKAGYKYDIYNGEVKEKETYYNFKEGEVGNVIIANIGSGAEGLNRQKWNSVLFYHMPSVYHLYIQAISRVLRPGQKADEVYVGVLMVANSIDEKVYAALMEGQDYDEKSFERDYLSNDIY